MSNYEAQAQLLWESVLDMMAPLCAKDDMTVLRSLALRAQSEKQWTLLAPNKFACEQIRKSLFEALQMFLGNKGVKKESWKSPPRRSCLPVPRPPSATPRPRRLKATLTATTSFITSSPRLPTMKPSPPPSASPAGISSPTATRCSSTAVPASANRT